LTLPTRRRRGGHFWSPNSLIVEFGDKLGPIGLAVYATLACHANQRSFEQTGMRQSWPSLGTVAKEIGCHKRSVIRALKSLELLGLVRVERNRTNDRGGWTSNKYTLVNPPEAAHRGDDQRTLFDLQQGAHEGTPAYATPPAPVAQNGAAQPLGSPTTYEDPLVTHSHHPCDSGTPPLVTQGHYPSDPQSPEQYEGEQNDVEQNEGGGVPAAAPPPQAAAAPPLPPQPSGFQKPRLYAPPPAPAVETHAIDDGGPVSPLNLAKAWCYHCKIPVGSKVWDAVEVLEPQFAELSKRVDPDRIMDEIIAAARDHGEVFSSFRKRLLSPAPRKAPSREEVSRTVEEERARQREALRNLPPPGTFGKMLEAAGLKTPQGRKP
jgi:hypothetical protein